MFITRLTQIDLAMRAGDIMTHTDFTRAQEWVKEFIAKGNIKSTISETKQDGLDMIAQQLARNCMPYWAGGDKAAQFLRYRVEQEEVINGLFWGDCGGNGSSEWHYVNEKALTV